MFRVQNVVPSAFPIPVFMKKIPNFALYEFAVLWLFWTVMTASEERRRFDGAMSFVGQALPRINMVFSGSQKIENIIIAYKYLEAASKVLGREIIASSVADDQNVRALLDAIDREVDELVEKIERPAQGDFSENGNIIDVHFQ